MKHAKEYTPQPECPNCGGTHFGSRDCPYTKAACVVCGTPTIYACSDCRIDTSKSVHVCEKVECQRQHETAHKGAQSKTLGTVPRDGGTATRVNDSVEGSNAMSVPVGGSALRQPGAVCLVKKYPELA